jgi:hypothetical protein
VIQHAPAGRSRVTLPALPVRRPLRLTLNARTPDGRGATDSLRLHPAGWLPAETAELVADGVHNRVHSGAEVPGCRRMSAARVDCRVAGNRGCAIAAIWFAHGRVRLPLWLPATADLREGPAPAAPERLGCRSPECPPALFGRLDGTAILPARWLCDLNGSLSP